MTLRVVGTGLGQTGTDSLKLALGQLLESGCHMSEVLADPERASRLAHVLRGGEADREELFAGYVAQVDFLGAAFWPEFSSPFADALIVLFAPL